MKIERYIPLIIGFGLVAIGAISLAGNLLLRLEAWRLWPITVILLGLALTAPGFWGLSRRGLGSFFIPGLLVLTTGVLLMIASLTTRWGIWALAWPLEDFIRAFGSMKAVHGDTEWMDPGYDPEAFEPKAVVCTPKNPRARR